MPAAALRIPTELEFSDALDRGLRIFDAADDLGTLQAAFGADGHITLPVAEAIFETRIKDSTVTAADLVTFSVADGIVLGLLVGRELFA